MIAGCSSFPMRDSSKLTYSKTEVMIAMRDGVKLFTQIYSPIDDSKQYPILLKRTPYGIGPYGKERMRKRLGPTSTFDSLGYIFVYQDVRGRNMSEGRMDYPLTPHLSVKKDKHDTDESSDTYDTIDWLIKNVSNHNGNVGQHGISYPGFYTAAGMIDAHPALKIASPQAPVTDMFIGDDDHHNGAFFLPHSFTFYISGFGEERTTNEPEGWRDFDYGTEDGYKFFLEMGPVSAAEEKYFKKKNRFWTQYCDHDQYDEYWQKQNIGAHIKDVSPFVLTVGGFFDAEDLYGPLNIFRQLSKFDKDQDHMLVMGPWNHGSWVWKDCSELYNMKFDHNTAAYFQDEVFVPLFEQYLRGGEQFDMPKAMIFETGAGKWQRYHSWPPAHAKRGRLYLHGNGNLETEKSDDSSGLSYVSDPANPVPYSSRQTTGMDARYMMEDQSFLNGRKDVLEFSTGALAGSMRIVGPISANVSFVAGCTDLDIVVKLIDKYQDEKGNVKKIMIRGEVFRTKFRDDYTLPSPLIEGQIEHVSFELRDIHHKFQEGHELLIQVQSSWFPLVDRNPQKFLNIFKAQAEDYVPCDVQLLIGGEHASSIDYLYLLSE